MSSLIKFTLRHQHNGQKLHWGRLDVDGLPFRGQSPPMYTEEEFETKVHRVGDPNADVFDLTDREQKQAYLGVLDGVINGWFQCLCVERWRGKKPGQFFVYIEWVEYFLEDGDQSRRTRYAQLPQAMELPNDPSHAVTTPLAPDPGMPPYGVTGQDF